MPVEQVVLILRRILQAVVAVPEVLGRTLILQIMAVMAALGQRIFIEQDRMYFMLAVEAVVLLTVVVMVQAVWLERLVPVVEGLVV